MAKPEWGQKRQCPSCGCRFYDMTRSPILCPKCGITVEPDQPIRTRRSGGGAAVVEKAALAVAVSKVAVLEDDLDLAVADEADIDLDVEEDAETDDDTLIEDTSDLGEDDDDMAEVIEHMDSDRLEEG